MAAASRSFFSPLQSRKLIAQKKEFAVQKFNSGDASPVNRVNIVLQPRVSNLRRYGSDPSGVVKRKSGVASDDDVSFFFASLAEYLDNSRRTQDFEIIFGRLAMEDLWRVAFPVGTEWDQLDAVYQFNWNFSNLENAFEEGGVLHGKKVYLFGCTEPQLVEVNGINKVICVPAIVAVVSPFPPSDKIGIKSVQREVEEIIPMKQMKMDWVPYIPLAYRDDQVERLRSQIFILSCTQRRVALRHLKIERLKKYEYCLPYFYQPFKEDEFEQSTEVDIMFPAEPAPIVCVYDWEMDDYEEFAEEQTKHDESLKSLKDDFKKFVQEKVKEAKKANREAREARKKAIEQMSEETKTAYDNIRFYKFYPVQTPASPDVSKVKSPFINRYYGKAHEVM